LKKFTLTRLLVLTLVAGIFSLTAKAQAPHGAAGHKCGTDEVMERTFQQDPKAKARYEAYQAQLEKAIQEVLNNPNTAAQYRTQAISTVPVVVHILLPDPTIVTNAIVQNQIDTLNRFYGAAPTTDSSQRVYTPFRTRYGRSDIRFCMAQRTPTNTPTNGINRVVYNGSFSTATHPSTVQPAWDPTKYLNIWVVELTGGVLGYSYLPGTFAPNDNRNGFVNDYRAFGSGAAHIQAPYNGGKTAVHEIGHYFNLQHPWGPGNSNPSCNGSDNVDDTPPTNGPYFGCATTGPVTSTSCPATGADGINWQNHMDYTEDACMIMFTQLQCVRMNTAITTSPDRVGLTTSNGCTPVVSNPNNAGVAILSPLSGTSLCVGTIAPQITLFNNGNNALTSVTISVVLNGGTPVVTNWTGNLAAFSSTPVTLGALTLGSGTNTITVTLSQPNGVADTDNSDNTASVNNITGGTSAGNPGPLVEGFEGTTFPPTGWTLINPNAGTRTWARTTAAAKTGTASAWLDFYNYSNTGHIDRLQTPIMNMTQTQLFVNFSYAYRTYINEADELEVRISTDCGTTWTSLWKKAGLALSSSTPGAQTAAYVPQPNQWKDESINISTYRNQAFIIEFKTVNQYGNNLYLDDINIFGSNIVNNDAQVSAINQPSGSFCSSTSPAQVVVKNVGLLPLTSFKVNTRVDNGTVVTQSFTGQNIASGASATVNLANITGLTAGNHTYTAYTTEPNGVADQQSANDTARGTFVANIPVPLPVVEGFEGTTFPPNGWAVINPNAGSVTWTRSTTAAKTGSASATVNHYNYSTNGHLDYLRAPAVNFNNAFDSAFISFQHAYKLYSNTLTDTLEVVVSTDCGTNWTSVWKRGGSQLATTGGTGGAGFVPTAAMWSTSPTRVDLGAYLNAGPIFVALRSKNGFGQNVFVDDINIFGKNIPDHDAANLGFVNLGAEVCDLPFTPRISVANAGKLAIGSLKINYSIDNGPVVSQTFATANIARGASAIFTLNPITTLTPGAHTIKYYTSEPNNVADQQPGNDTLTASFTLLTNRPVPFVEGFEGTTFPPAGWNIVQTPVDVLTWQRTAQAGRFSTASAYMNNWNYAQLGRVDEMISPVIKYTGADSVFLKFDVGALTYSYPGSTAVPMDTLEVFITKDCGMTYQSIYKKWGYQLQTMNDPNYNNDYEFIPKNDRHWRRDSINLAAMLGTSNVIRVKFRNTENYENNIFVDNINFEAKQLPAKLKSNGVMITPNPFQTAFAIQHYLAPKDLRGFGVYNALGQQVYSRSYGEGGADSYIHVDLSNLAAGIYTVKLMYTNRTVSQRIVKLGK